MVQITTPLDVIRQRRKKGMESLTEFSNHRLTRGMPSYFAAMCEILCVKCESTGQRDGWVQSFGVDGSALSMV
jgi:hypothetical protein